MCVTTRKERENDRLKAILPSEINLTQMQELFPPQSPENREREICLCHYRKSVLDKREKIEMLDYKTRN